MKKSRFAGLKDYLALIVRRKWWILGTFIIFAGLAALFAKILPVTYLSESTIQIQQRDIPSDFVKDLIAGNTDQRLSIIEQTILSRTNLLKVLSEFERELGGYRGMNDQAKVARLAKRIRIRFPTERVRGTYLPVTSIRISYRDRNPELAQKITSRLTALFIEQDNLAREEQVYGTTQFLSAELEKVALQLRESESRLQAIKGRYRYELPTERDTNLRTLDRLQTQKNSNIEALDRYMSLKLNLEQQLSEIPPEIPREQAMRASAPAADPALEAYRKKEQEYRELVARAKDTHPEVRRVKAELDELRKALPEEALLAVPDGQAGAEQETDPAMAPNPAYQNLATQLRQVNTEIEIREREKTWIENEIALYNRRVANTPRVEQEIAEAVRLNDDLMKEHDSLKAKLSQARLSESAESRQKGAQFRVLDPANYPFEPTPPTPPVIFLAGLAISLLLGVAVAFVVDMASPRVITQAELERVLPTRVLAEIPRITSPSDIRKRRRMGAVYAASGVALAGLYGGCLYLLYLKQSRLLQILDPVIQKIQG